MHLPHNELFLAFDVGRDVVPRENFLSGKVVAFRNGAVHVDTDDRAIVSDGNKPEGGRLVAVVQQVRQRYKGH